MKPLIAVFAALAVFASLALAHEDTEPAAPPRAGGANAALPVMGSLDRITGFRTTAVAAQREREGRAAATIRPDSLRRHARILTEEPHVAGTPGDSATAEYVRQRLAAYGWDARIERVPAWLNWPRRVSLAMVEPDSAPLAVRESGAAWDKDAHDSRVLDAFHGYGASGTATAQVVYANFGDVGDFAALAALGIDVRGRVVLVRYGKIFRGLKVRNAERAGAAGVLVYSDPADDGFARADEYPRGQGRPADAIQRGSVQYLSEGPGDPTTPGWASTPGARRLKRSEVRGVPRIPSLPIAWGEARKLLHALEGPQAPAGWQGGLPFTYHVGPGPAAVRMDVDMDDAVRPIWNVIATLAGREHPEQRVVCGNHRDAWTYGAIDPNSGTICMLEMGRAIGELAKSGWRPRRTIVLASWDGEEYGLLGSTEWCEANAAALQGGAVAYLNVDAAVSGRDLRAGGSHALTDVFAEALREVPDPHERQPLWRTVLDRSWSEGRAEWSRRNRERRWRHEPARAFELALAPLGSGSDYTAFLDHLGVPSLDMGFGGLHGTYHSTYDDFEFLDRVVDPGYARHVALTDLWQRITLRLAEAEVLPLRYSRTGTWALDELQSLEERADDAGAGKPDSLRLEAPTTGVRDAAARLRNAAVLLERRADELLAAADTTGLARLNAALTGAERAMLGPGLPGRTWFRHELYAPGLNTGYAAVPLPRLGQAVLDADARAWARGLGPLEDALRRATEVLAGGR